MYNLIILKQTLEKGYDSYWLSLLSLCVILCGVIVIVNRNPIISILFLIGLFGTISIYLILLDLTYIGLSYLIIYIGAVSILFIFILMLLDIRLSELQNNNWNSIALAFYISAFFSYLIFEILPYNFDNYNIIKNWVFLKKKNSILISSDNWDGNIVDISHISSIGSVLYTSHNIWIILSSFILLLAMVGTITITIKNSTENINIRKSR